MLPPSSPPPLLPSSLMIPPPPCTLLQECHAIIYVVDSSDRERIEQSKETFNSMISNENVRGVPLLVAANKQDLEECMGVREVKPLFEANLELVGSREVRTEKAKID